MRKTYLILLYIILFIFTSCNSSKNNEQSSKDSLAPSKASIINNKVIAVLDNKNFTNSDFKNFLRLKYSDMKSILNNGKLASRLFDSFIEYSIILKSSENDDILVTDKEISDYSGKKNIKLSKGTAKSIKNLIRIQKFLFHKIYKNITVSKFEINKYYNLNRKDFSQKRRIELYQILLKNKEDAIRIRSTLLNSPSEFETIARTKSASQDASKNGYMGIFEYGDLPKEMEKVVFSLPLNRISRIVESPFGFHIFKVSKVFGRKQKYLKNVTDEIEEIIFNKKMVDEFNRYIKILKNNINIRINYENLFFKYVNLKGE